MTEQLGDLFWISVVAFTVPFVLGFWPRLRIPVVVVEILAGVALGPDGLGVLHIGPAVGFLSSLGIAFLLFLAGLELDLRPLRGAPIQRGVIGFGVSFVVALAGALVLGRAGLVHTPLVLAVALCSTSVGIVVPVLAETRNLDTAVGRATVASGAVAEFCSIVLLGVLLAVPVTSFYAGVVVAVSGVAAVAVFAVIVAGVLWFIRRAMRWRPGQRSTDRMDLTSSQLRTRLAVMLILGMALLAASFGFEAILGTFIAGIFFGGVIRDDPQEELYRTRLEALGFGFFVPIFFITTGIRIDLDKFLTLESLLKVTLFLVLLLVARGVAALLYRRELGTAGTVATGLMLATNIAFVVVVAGVAVEAGTIRQNTASALVVAGLLSALIFPTVAQLILSRSHGGQDGGDVAPGRPAAEPA